MGETSMNSALGQQLSDAVDVIEEEEMAAFEHRHVHVVAVLTPPVQVRHRDDRVLVTADHLDPGGDARAAVARIRLGPQGDRT